jgi:hypothetical protein
MAFEDSENGVKSVLDAGIRALLVAINPYTQDQDFTGAGLVVDQYGEPDSPFQVLQGDPGEKRLVDLELVKTLHASTPSHGIPGVSG